MSKYDFSCIGSAIEKRIAKGILPGAIASVNIDGKNVYEYVGGYADVDLKQVLKKDALFRLASMTKPITAVACLICQEKGWLSVTDKISKFLPEFKDMYVGEIDENGKLMCKAKAEKEITIEDILTHCSGLGSGVVGAMQYPEYGHKDGKNLAETVHGYSKMLLDFSPATSQLYSAAQALDIVARIVEIVSQMPYEEFLKNYMFKPLEMDNTAYNLTEEQWKRVVTMYKLSDDVTNITKFDLGRRPFVGFPEGYTGGTAGLYSCLDDYVKFANMLCNNGEANGKRILSADSVRQMRTPHFENGFAGINPFFNWGYGVRVVEEQKEGVQPLSKGSFGWSGAFNTHFFIDPVLNLTGVFMSNMDNAGGAGAITAFEFEVNTMNAIKGGVK